MAGFSDAGFFKVVAIPSTARNFALGREKTEPAIARGVRGLGGAFPFTRGAGIFRPSRFTVMFSFVAYVVYFFGGIALAAGLTFFCFAKKKVSQEKASPAGGPRIKTFAPVV